MPLSYPGPLRIHPQAQVTIDSSFLVIPCNCPVAVTMTICFSKLCGEYNWFHLHTLPDDALLTGYSQPMTKRGMDMGDFLDR